MVGLRVGVGGQNIFQAICIRKLNPHVELNYDQLIEKDVYLLTTIINIIIMIGKIII